MENGIEIFLKQKKIAVVGSFRSQEKVAYRILLKLLAAGYDVCPVNPTAEIVAGIKCYSSIAAIPFGIDAVDIVTPPPVTETVIAECIKKNIKNIWMQPGAESKKAIEICEKNGLNFTYGACLMIEIDR